MYFKPIYDTNTSEIEKFNDTLCIEKYNILIKNVHLTWCDHLMEVKDSKYDVAANYDLSNHMKVPILKKKQSFNIIKCFISCKI